MEEVIGWIFSSLQSWLEFDEGLKLGFPVLPEFMSSTFILAELRSFENLGCKGLIQVRCYTLPETNSAPVKIPIFPGKYHQNGGFSHDFVSFREKGSKLEGNFPYLREIYGNLRW